MKFINSIIFILCISKGFSGEIEYRYNYNHEKYYDYWTYRIPGTEINRIAYYRPEDYMHLWRSYLEIDKDLSSDDRAVRNSAIGEFGFYRIDSNNCLEITARNLRSESIKLVKYSKLSYGALCNIVDYVVDKVTWIMFYDANGKCIFEFRFPYGRFYCNIEIPEEVFSEIKYFRFENDGYHSGRLQIHIMFRPLYRIDEN